MATRYYCDVCQNQKLQNQLYVVRLVGEKIGGNCIFVKEVCWDCLQKGCAAFSFELVGKEPVVR